MDELTPIFRIEHFLDEIVNGTVCPYSPEFRVEYFLAKIAGHDVEIPEPIFRIEKYLAYLCGEDVELPEPIFRIEKYLAAICGMSVEVPEPVFRVEFWLWDWSGGGDPLITLSGNIVRFTSKASKPMVEIVGEIEPVQDLHGYDNPWPAGGGKNLADPSKIVNQSISAQGAYVDQAGGEYRTLKVDLLKAGTYTVSISLNNPYFTRFRYVYNESVVVNGYFSHDVSSTTFTLNNDVTDFGITFRNQSTTEITETFTVQLESGNSATSYAPYSNECPITGWTGANVTGTGKNLWGFTADDFTNPTLYGMAKFIDVPLPAGTYTISSNAPTGYIWAGLNPQNSTRVYEDNPKTITLSSGNVLSLGVSRDYTDTALSYHNQLEEGSTATAYEPFGTTLPISWQTEAGTVYGGTLTINEDGSVKLRAEWSKGEISAANQVFGVGTSSAGIRYAQLSAQTTPDAKTNGKIITETYKNSSDAATNNSIRKIGQLSYVYDNRLTDLATAQTLLVGMDLFYELATPIEYDLSSVTILNTLKGENNVWTDTGDITVKAYGVEIVEPQLNSLQSLNLLLGNGYVNNHTQDDVSDDEALDIIMGGNER